MEMEDLFSEVGQKDAHEKGLFDELQKPARARQILTLTGLEFDATLGVLSHEKREPQPIRVDAEIHLGLQPLLPQGDDIQNVLDYRAVREIILETCTSKHVNLLETMIGQLAERLSCLPGVQGVRLKVAKLKIFDDCEVAIRVEAGQW